MPMHFRNVHCAMEETCPRRIRTQESIYLYHRPSPPLPPMPQSCVDPFIWFPAQPALEVYIVACNIYSEEGVDFSIPRDCGARTSLTVIGTGTC